MVVFDPSIPGNRTYLDSIARIDMHRDVATKKVRIDFTDYSGDDCRITMSFQTMEDMICLYKTLKDSDNKVVHIPGQLSIEDTP